MLLLLFPMHDAHHSQRLPTTHSGCPSPCSLPWSSVNYLHAGAGKQWYVIPPPYRTRFERLVRCLLGDLFCYCPEFMRHKVRGWVRRRAGQGGGWIGLDWGRRGDVPLLGVRVVGARLLCGGW